MAIEPAGIIAALKTINKDTPIEHFMLQLYMQLPTCISRAIATLQCTQLEPDFKAVSARLKAEFNFDLHEHLKEKTRKILLRL